MEGINNREYFYNFNALRFFLAASVLFYHVIEIMVRCGLYHNKMIQEHFAVVSIICVSFFFTLSGFLISYFLLREKYLGGQINLLQFYRNRVCRILPLYYFTIFIFWLVLPHSVFNGINSQVFYSHAAVPVEHVQKINLVLSLFLMPQIASVISLIHYKTIMYGYHLWSIGVEELFYLFFPLFLYYFASFRKSSGLLLGIYYALVLLTFFCIVINKFILHMGFLSALLKMIPMALAYNRIPCFIIGSVGAYLYLHRHRYLSYISSRKYIYIAALLIFLLLLFKFFMPFFVNEIYCILFVIVLVNVADRKNKVLNSRALQYLGKISYGIYMYHIAIIIVLIYFLQARVREFLFLILLAGSFLGTILVSVVSYELVERKIILWGKKKI